MEDRTDEQRGIEYYMQLPYSILLHQVEDEGQKYWMAEIPELPGCRSHGSTVEDAVRSVEEAKKDWILDSLEEKEEIPIPVEREKYSGRFLLRMSRSLHRALSLMAQSEGLSLNQLIVTMLAKEVGRFSVLNRVEDKINDLLDRMSDVVERFGGLPSTPFASGFRDVLQGRSLSYVRALPAIMNRIVWQSSEADTAQDIEQQTVSVRYGLDLEQEQESKTLETFFDMLFDMLQRKEPVEISNK